jgi:serine/threonine-protein kinase
VGAGETPAEAEAAAPADEAGLRLVLTWKNVALGGLALAALAGAGVAGWLLLGGEISSSPETIRSIAVLPFADMSPAGDQEYFADGMSEELINRLSKTPELRVVARTSAFAFKGKDVDIREIGEQLDVGALVEGSVRKAGDRLRITAQLVQVADGFHLWSETYERQLDDVFAMQDDLSRAIADALEARLDVAPASNPSTTDLRAYELYLMGRFFWNKRTEEGHRKAIRYFEQALALDPEYALAYSGLADSYGLLATDFGLLPEGLVKAREAATRAVRLDDSLAEGHASLGLFRYQTYDWPGAEVEFQRALAINPGYANAHLWYAMLLMTTGRIDESLAEIQQALQLDPLSSRINIEAGRLHVCARDYDTAVDRFERGLELDPDQSPVYLHQLAHAYHLAGMEAKAGKRLLDWAKSRLRPEVESLLRETMEHSGSRGIVRKLLELEVAGTGERCPVQWSIAVYAFLGEVESALACLQQAARRAGPFGWPGVLPVNYFKVHPVYDELRSDPRFTAILAEVRLED